jgi:multimeric flavodoxin WrbA
VGLLLIHCTEIPCHEFGFHLLFLHISEKVVEIPMEIITLLGSPRKKGNTATILAAFEQMIPLPHHVTRINLADYELRGCLGDDSCQKKMDLPGCVQKDDVARILEQMLKADVLVYASPLYCWDFSAQMKTVFDRHYCMMKWRGDKVAKSFFAGKKALLLVTCGGEVENNADVIQVVFQRQMDCLGCEITGQYIVPNCSLPKNLGGVVETTARRMVGELFAGAQG